MVRRVIMDDTLLVYSFYVFIGGAVLGVIGAMISPSATRYSGPQLPVDSVQYKKREHMADKISTAGAVISGIGFIGCVLSMLLINLFN